MSCLLDVETTQRTSLMLVSFQRGMADHMQSPLNLVKMSAKITDLKHTNVQYTQ